MAVVEGTNPNVRPSRRDHQQTDPFERVPITDDPTFRGAITKPEPASLTANARSFVRNVTQTDDLRGLGRRWHGFGAHVYSPENMPRTAIASNSTATERNDFHAVLEIGDAVELPFFSPRRRFNSAFTFAVVRDDFNIDRTLSTGHFASNIVNVIAP
jgi:hypothetical protein